MTAAADRNVGVRSKTLFTFAPSLAGPARLDPITLVQRGGDRRATVPKKASRNALPMRGSFRSRAWALAGIVGAEFRRLVVARLDRWRRTGSADRRLAKPKCHHVK